MYFDLKISALREHYSRTNPNGGYYEIRDFLCKNAFLHAQYSGYHSKYKLTDIDIFELVRDMCVELYWLPKCVNKFEVTNIGKNYDLLPVMYENSI